MPKPSEIIATLRKDLRLTQADMATRLKVRQNTVSRYEMGKANPSLEVLLSLYTLAKDHPEIQHEIEQLVEDRTQAIGSQLLKRMESAAERVRGAWGNFFANLTEEQRQELYREAFGCDPQPPYQKLPQEVRKLAESGLYTDDRALAKLIRLYREHGASPDVRSLFHKALNCLEVEISHLKSSRSGHKK